MDINLIIMKNIMLYIVILIISTSCCKKNNTTPNPLKGKIKRIQETSVVPNKSYYYDLHFFL